MLDREPQMYCWPTILTSDEKSSRIEQIIV